MKTTGLFACALLSFVMAARAAPLSGTRRIGPTGNYASITAAIADVGAQTLGGALVLELQPAYVSSVETFPLVFTNLTTTAAKTLTLRPAAGAVALAISSAASQTVRFDGAQFVTIDGRPGGVGSNAGSGVGAASQLTIANTSISGMALLFFNEASGNNLRYTTLQGVNTSNLSGVVVFSTTTGGNGNDNNTMDHCDIRDGASTPANGIYSLGLSGAPAQFNSGNIISNCNVFNFYNAAASTSNGLRLEGGNTDWTITGNSFYQTASRAGVAANVRTIYINNTSGNNFTVTGNFIGGSAPNAGGTAWTTTGTTSAYLFKGVWLNVGNAAPSSMQGNTIANIVWTSASTDTVQPGVWSGIYVQAGSVNIGTVTGNTIGSGTGTGSVSVTTSGNGGTSFGIAIGAVSGGIGSVNGGTVTIANNTVGSITVNGTSTAISASLIGIQVAAGANTISNNTVGSTTTVNSLSAATASTSATGQQVTGILRSSSGGASITSNTVANLNNNYMGSMASGQIRGIFTSTGVNTITGNTVRNLSTTSRNADTGAYDSGGQSVLGIAAISTAVGQTVSQNIVHSLANTAASGNISVTGIYYRSSFSSGGNLIARNLVHSLAISSSSSSAAVQGMEFNDGVFTAQNNMVRVGLDSTGASTAVFSIVRGIYDNSTSAGRNFYHNSVYLGGTQTSAQNATCAFISSGSTNARTYQNNIFANARSNGGANRKHYAVIYGGSGVNPTGLTAGGNLFHISGTGGVLSIYNGAERNTLAAWQAATGQDATSAVGDPLFANPSGDASAVDLHLQASNPAEGGGIALTDSLTGAPVTVTDDFDGETRSTLTPSDVGADAGNFTPTGDIFAPGISYPLLSNGSTANRVLTGWATITDNNGVSGGASVPRLYYKKSTDADVFGVANDSTGNGWKYVSATGSSPYSFTLDYSLIYGGSVTVGNTIQYFVVAQDAANNLGSRPAGSATASANPPVQNVNAHGAVNSFSILPSISGTKTVGTVGDYSSLTGAGGLFAALNAGVVTGNVLVKIISDLTEDGMNALNEITRNEFPTPADTVTIQPDAATMRTISRSLGTGLIRLNGADRVTIDGRFGGAGRYLTFRSSSGGSDSTILFINDASGNIVRNCIVEGAGFVTGGVIFFSTGAVTGNNSNLITDCQVRDLSTAVGVPIVLIRSSGENLGNIVSNNELFNFSTIAIYITGGQSWTLSGNTIYEVNASTTSVAGILMENGSNHVSSGNSIHNLLTTSSSSTGIIFSGSGTATIAGNRITAFQIDAATTTVTGISASGFGSLNVVNNQITLSPDTSVSRSLLGIYDAAYPGSVVNVFSNSVVLGGTESGTQSSWASLRRDIVSASTHTARDNIFLNLRTGGSGNHFAAGNRNPVGSYTVSHNVYAGTGATAANFMDRGSATNFAGWQAITGDTSSQAGIAGGGNFTAAMFVSAATGDLHLIPGGNVLVNGLGTPIAGVTTDFDGDFRSATAPTIGSDEFTLPSAFSTWAAANGVSTDPNATGANGVKNLLNFALGISPTTGGPGGLQYAGTFAGNGAITATGLPVTMLEGAGNAIDLRALFVRRKDFAAAGLTYTPQFSTDLAAWANSAAVPTVLADDGVNQIVSVPFPTIMAGNSASFFRLGVSLAP